MSKEWESIFDAVPDLFAVIDTNYKIVWINRAMAEKTGVVKDEATGLPCYKLIHNTDEPLPSCPHAHMMTDLEEHFAEMYIEKFNGAYAISVSPLRNDEGDLIGCIHIARDITKSKQTEEALKKSEARYRALVENAGDIIFRTDEAGIFTFINPMAMRVSGYLQEELIGKHYLTLIKPDMRDEIAKFLGRQFVKRIKNTYYEFPMITKDGRELWIGQNTQLLTEGDQVTGFQAVARDITERRHIEKMLKDIDARFKIITDNMSDTIWLMDLNFKTTWISPSVERKRGYSLDEINALPLEKHLAPASLKIALEALSKGLNPELLQRKDIDLSTTLELEYFKKDGSTYWSESRFSLLRDREGVPVCILGVGRDITERKRAEEALKDSEQRLQSIMQASPIPAFVIGKDHRVVYWNRALEELSGIKAEEVIGSTKQWRAFYSEERPCMADLLLNQELDAIPRWYCDKYIKSSLIEDAYEATDFFPALGNIGKWLHFTAALIRDSYGELVGAIETLEDVTDRKQASDTLEKQVKERTADLLIKNEQLINEIKEHKQTEAELNKRKIELEAKSTKLEGLNTTLKILLDYRDEDKKETEENVMSNIKNIIIPHIDKLKKSRLDAKTMLHVSALESNLLDITSRFSCTLSSKYIYMTPKEIQVANFVKEGKSTKEIAEIMDVSSYAIELHRFNIRKKLGLTSRKINLKSYLLSIS